jgi:hypothetical protein
MSSPLAAKPVISFGADEPDTGPLTIRNTTTSPVVFSFGTNANESMEWKGLGDPGGDDIQVVDRKTLTNVRFRRALTLGILEIEDAPEEINRALVAQREEWDARQLRVRQASQDALDMTPQNDLVMLRCIAPAGPKSSKQCETEFSTRAKERDQRPPLCPIHTPMASQYVSDESEEMNRDTGKPLLVWKRVPITQRVKGES